MRPTVEQLEPRDVPSQTPLEGFAWTPGGLAESLPAVGSPVCVTVSLDPSLTLVEVQAVVQAVRSLDRLPDGARLVFASGGDVTVSVIPEDASPVPGAAGLGTARAVHLVGHSLDLYPPLLANVFQHEFGHALGLGHDESNGVDMMYPLVGVPRFWTGDSLGALVRLYGLWPRRHA